MRYHDQSLIEKSNSLTLGTIRIAQCDFKSFIIWKHLVERFLSVSCNCRENVTFSFIAPYFISPSMKDKKCILIPDYLFIIATNGYIYSSVILQSCSTYLESSLIIERYV